MTDVTNIPNNVVELQVVSDEVCDIVSSINISLESETVSNDLRYHDQEQYEKDFMSSTRQYSDTFHRGMTEEQIKNLPIIQYENEEPFFVKQIRQNRISRHYFLRRIVDEYCGIYYLQNEFRVNFNDLSFEDKKLFLSHVVDAWEYEEYCSSVSALHAGFLDNLKYMQRLLDETSEDFYQEYLQEMGSDSTTLEYEYGISR